MASAVERLMRRVQNMVGMGSTSAPVDDTGAVQTVQVLTKSGIPVSGVPVVSLFGVSSVMPVGSNVALLAIAGDSSALMAVATAHQGSRPKNTPAGGVVLHDELGGMGATGASLAFTNDGNAVLTLGTSCTVKIGGTTAVLSATGITITGGDVIADGISLKHHKHPTAPEGPVSEPIA